MIATVADSHDVMPVDSVDRFTADRMDVSAALIEDLEALGHVEALGVLAHHP